MGEVARGVGVGAELTVERECQHPSQMLWKVLVRVDGGAGVGIK